MGSRHDPVARSLATLPHGALCGADDLTRAGWCWPLNSPEAARWVVDGRIVEDSAVSGVLVRRTFVYPEELAGTHPDDREYVAAEATSFLAFVLSRSGGRVVNPPIDGALGDDAVRPERWMSIAADLAIPVAPVRMRSSGKMRVPATTATVEVAVGRAFGGGPLRNRAAAVVLAGALGLDYVSVVFDERGRLLAISTMTEPRAKARAALAKWLGERP